MTNDTMDLQALAPPNQTRRAGGHGEVICARHHVGKISGVNMGKRNGAARLQEQLGHSVDRRATGPPLAG